MNYPFWDVPHLGSGWVIGMIAIFHVMISHFAVGGGFYLVLAERKALKEGRRHWLPRLQAHSKFFLILTGVFGAVTGVGIWFAIGLAHPEATSALIHNFVFGWAIEWVFFMVELTTAAVYYYTWNRVSDEMHVKVGWVYAIASFCTLFIINGILTFMLTPGAAWLGVAGTGNEAREFWAAFFNPLFWPSLFLRFLACVSLAGVWALVVHSRLDEKKDPGLKESLVLWSAKWILPSFALLPVFFFWYMWNVPAAQRALIELGVSGVGAGQFSQLTRTVLIIPLASISVVGLVYFFAIRSPREMRFGQAAAVVLVALFATASTEYGREMLRKPFVIGEYMYSNGVRKMKVSTLNTNGYLATSLWTRPVAAGASDREKKLAIGEAMFRGQCGSCHTRDTYRSMTRLLGDRNREGIGSVLKILHEYPDNSPYRKFMPPLVGKPEEVEALGDYLETLVKKPVSAAAPEVKPVASTNRPTAGAGTNSASK
jgi:cytochrome bd-type quinol oxidase subunit 1